MRTNTKIYTEACRERDRGIPNQLAREESHPSRYRFELHPWAPCLSLQSLHHHDDPQSSQNSTKKL